MLLNSPTLTHLNLLDSSLLQWYDSMYDMQPSAGPQAVAALRVLKLGSNPAGALGPSHVECIVTCCPQLQELASSIELYSVYEQQHCQPTALSRLRQLSRLIVRGHAVDDGWVEGVLLKLPALQDLAIRTAKYFTGLRLLALRQLTQLTSLCLEGTCKHLEGFTAINHQEQVGILHCCMMNT